MKLPLNADGNAIPEPHDLFLEWKQASSDAHAAVLQGLPNATAMLKASHDKLEAYLASVRADFRGARRRGE